MTRQEVVHMLPPPFLDVELHNIVLSMCAAPGILTILGLPDRHSYRDNNR